MGIWLELGIFGVVIVFGIWQMHDVRKAQAHTRQQRALAQAQAPQDPAAAPETSASQPSEGH